MTRNLSVRARVSTLALSIALVAGPSPAVAQSFQGSGSFTNGTGSISTPDSVTTNISVTSPQAVIDWTPTDNAINNGQQIVFQAGGTTATFSSTSDFAVLNRINQTDMTRMIRMGGTINGLVNGQTGGSVYFYSPGGFILGATSVINVGSLVLTASPITVDPNHPNGSYFIDNGQVEFGQALNAAAEIETHPLTQISALNQGSYVAMVAPRVQHHGSIAVNGAAALVGAEAATITFRPSGLFDIEVDVGTTDFNGVAVFGDIGGPASSGAGDNHRVYMVAVAKNTALTMLISAGSDIGFDVAGAANVVGNAVVLSAGHDVFFGSAEFDQSTAGGAPANMSIFNANFTSAVSGTASGNIDVTAASGGTTRFFSNASLRSSGGYIQVESFGAGSLLDVDGNLNVITDRFGQSEGESVTAGPAAIYAQGGGTLNVDGNVDVSANGFGGDSFESGNAGNGTGGQVLIQAETDSSLTIGGSIFATADGFGGQPGSPGRNAGNGNGGSVFIGTIGDNATLGVGTTTFARASGFGGHGDGSSNECFSCDGLGGTGDGGFISVGKNQGTGSTLIFGGDVTLIAEGEGGRSALAGSASGSGIGGDVSISSSGDSPVEGFGLHFAGNLDASAIGRGGESSTPGITAGLGDGGTIFLLASAGGTIGISGDYNANANGHGGFNDFDVDGGDGIGGFVAVTAQGGNSSISVTGDSDLRADGEASVDNSDCTACGGAGGDGLGGTVVIYGTGFDTGNVVNFAGSLDMSAEGWGGIGVTGNAGLGDGGTAEIQAEAGFTVNVGLDARIEAEGYGGYAFNGNTAGDGVGGFVSISGNGGTVDVNGSLTLDANGTGGNTGIAAGGIAGNGQGGNAQLVVGAGSVDVAGNLIVESAGEGGDSVGGTGGNATGGMAFVGAPGGVIHVAGNLSMNGGATGGDGNTGGNASALISDPQDEEQPVAVALYVQDSGTIAVDGATTLRAESVGGNGANGNGGNAQGGEVDVVGYVGSITLAATTIDVDGRGGAGGLGGNGGNGIGGSVDVAFGFQAAVVGGTMTLGTATVTADGLGGAGGAGASGTTGGSGGAGGVGSGGEVIFAGSAAGGTLVSGTAALSATGTGGAGGAGGNGVSGAGGNGGAGGQADGGFIQAGTLSSETAPTSGGGATYANLAINTSATGGAGGNGGTGGAGSGAGGDGGHALGGESNFLVRGVLVTADAVTLNASATGGNGGTGSALGDGGDATTGFIAVESKDRFQHPTERGTLQADSIIGTATAAGGIGATNGASIVADGSYFRVLNGDATIGSVSITLSGQQSDPTFGPSLVSVRDGTATIGDFSFVTSGELALDASNGSMTAGTITLSAATFVPDDFNPPPTAPGSYSADSFAIATGGDFITNANLISTSTLILNAPGLVDMADATSGGDFVGSAGSTFAAGSLTAAGSVTVSAPGAISLDLIDAGTDISILSFLGSVGVNGTSSADGSIFVSGVQGVSVGPMTAMNEISVGSETGDVTIGDSSSTLGSIAVSAGGSIVTGDLAANANIDMAANGGITFQDATADRIDFESGGAVSGGNIVAGTFATGEAEGAITLGNINVGVLRAGGATDDGFAVGIVSATSVSVQDVEADEAVGFATRGNLTTGDISAGGLFMALAGGDIATGSIATTGEFSQVYMADDSMYDIGTQNGTIDFDANLVLPLDPIATGGSITIGGPVTTGLFQAAAGSNFSALGISSSSDIAVSAGGTAAVGGAWSAQYVQLVSNDIDITANGSIGAGEIDLLSSNATQTVVGDGVAGGGYQLSDAEYDRLDSGDIDVIADAALGAATRILIGDLSVTGSGGEFGSEYEFVTFDSDSENVVGSIRIVGDAQFSGMGANDGVAFTTNRFELDAATGLLSLENAPGTLGGTIFLDAAHIHVASGNILDQLAEDPQYDGYQDDLNAPVEVERPDGVVRAASIEIEFADGGEAELNTLYVQNTGTAANPAGFLISGAALFGEGNEVTPPPGSIDLVINGQIVTEGGTLTGIEVRDALVEAEGDITPFTANSTINGCLLTGSCATPTGGPFPPGFNPAGPGIQDEITLIDDGLLPPPEFGNEDFIDDNVETTTDGATSPITPPTPLFDTSELGGKSDVDDPVSGSGNPALMENPAGDAPCPTGGSQPAGQCKQEKQP